MTAHPTHAELWADSAERLTPREKWTTSAKMVVLLAWYGTHRGQYLSNEVAERVLEEAYLRPMPTTTFAEICAGSRRIPEPSRTNEPCQQ